MEAAADAWSKVFFKMSPNPAGADADAGFGESARTCPTQQRVL
jgi:hypothetical protein